MSDAQHNLDENIEQVLAYHRLSKHHLHRYAPAPGQLDWANQPQPFRTFAGSPLVELPLLADALPTSYADLTTVGVVAPRRLDVNSIAILFELGLGLSAWKEHGASRWVLRCNPSSGNLHPTEGYAILPPLPGITAGVYHYLSHDHSLEQRRAFSTNKAARLAEMLPPQAFLIGLSSIPWREAWKYGLRAFRYCQHDIGHALAALRYAAAALGWSARLLDYLGDDTIATWLGLKGSGFAEIDSLDHEHPGALVLVGPAVLPVSWPNLAPPASGEWLGSANRLSSAHVRWDAIDEVAGATWKPLTDLDLLPAPPLLPSLPTAPAVSAAALIRQRRSCLSLDGRTSLDAAAFYRLLDSLLPRPEVVPWDLLPWQPCVHAVVFVHRVRGLEPGLYFFERSRTVHDTLKAACLSLFQWRRPKGCPEHLDFYLLNSGDYREEARTICCHQDIAADGAFSLGMVAAFGGTIRQCGPWWYRRLFWEAGVLGQVLYLEAEAARVRGTGIGCYFDDACHKLLGLAGDTWQDLYHFTVGGPVEDPRLHTLMPYGHLTGR